MKFKDIKKTLEEQKEIDYISLIGEAQLLLTALKGYIKIKAPDKDWEKKIDDFNKKADKILR